MLHFINYINIHAYWNWSLLQYGSGWPYTCVCHKYVICGPAKLGPGWIKLNKQQLCISVSETNKHLNFARRKVDLPLIAADNRNVHRAGTFGLCSVSRALHFGGTPVFQNSGYLRYYLFRNRVTTATTDFLTNSFSFVKE